MAALDPDFQALLGEMKASEGAANSRAASHLASTQDAPYNPYDPAMGGLPFQVGPLNTGLTMPQGLSQYLAGTGQGMTDVVRHGGNLVGLESDQALQDAKQIDAPLLNTTAGRLGQLTGQTAAITPFTMGVGAGVGQLGSLGARAAASPIAMGAIQGGAQGALMADPGQRLQGLGVGALTGAAVPAVAAGAKKLVTGLTRTPAAQELLDAGISLTPGQMNPTGMANRMEQALEGAAGVGDLVQNARDKAMKQYTREMVNRSMAPGASLPANVTDFNDMIDTAAKSFDTAYDVAKGFPVGPKIMNQTGPDIPLSQALKTVATRARPGITGQEQASVGRNLQDLLSQTIKDAKQTGGMESDDLISLRSTFRDLMRGESGIDNASRARKALYGDAVAKVSEALKSQIPTDASAALDAADQQYAKFAIVRDAAKAAKDAPGGPTPFQISSAIAKATPANTYARGAGLNRDLSKAARETFQSNVPRTGLAGVGRLLLPASIAGPALLSHPAIAGPALGGMAALTLTPGGRALAAGTTPLQKALASQLASLQGLMGPIGTDLAGQYGRNAITNLLVPRLQQMPSGGGGQ